MPQLRRISPTQNHMGSVAWVITVAGFMPEGLPSASVEGGPLKRVLLGFLILLVGAAGGVAAWAVDYDRRGTGLFFPGTTIAGVAVTGLDEPTALGLVAGVVEEPLRQPLRITAGEATFMTSPWELGFRTDAASAVRQEMTAVRSAGFASRLRARLLTPRRRSADVRPRWQPGALDALVARVAAEVDREPRSAVLDYSTGWLKVEPEQRGRKLDVERARVALREAAMSGRSSVSLELADVAPEETADAFKQAILVRTGENKLYLYEEGRIVKSWPVATGAPGFATPAGLFRVEDKYVNPEWINPGSSWATGMPRVIPGGPGNPLGTHALALDEPGILIHATSDTASIGYNASHGCIRMTEANELELFSVTQVGTPVVVTRSSSPQPRPAAPAPTDPTALAVASF